MLTGTSPLAPRNQHGQEDQESLLNNDANANSLLKGVVHQRSQSLSGVSPSGGTTDSPKHGGKLDKIGQSPETQLKYENERLRLALAQRYTDKGKVYSMSQ